MVSLMESDGYKSSHPPPSFSPSNIPLHIAIPRFISSPPLSSSSSSSTSILSAMSSFQTQNVSQVGVPSLGLCLKLADFGDVLKIPSASHPSPSSSSNEDLVVAYLELSVRFEELREEFNHLIECHWVPLQRFSQGVLSSLSLLASAPVNEGLYCAGCGGRILSYPFSQRWTGEFHFRPRRLLSAVPRVAPRVGVRLLLLFMFIMLRPSLGIPRLQELNMGKAQGGGKTVFGGRIPSLILKSRGQPLRVQHSGYGWK